jgi:uncharacterized protein YdcH (DUF465 family)
MPRHYRRRKKKRIIKMLHEYREEISILKVQNAHFAKIFEKHNELDQKITDIDEGREHLDQIALEKLKKEKLKLKDEAYAMILKYKNENK